jgi:1,4-dihydroxy-2-naphthoyl-CoA hydrolase
LIPYKSINISELNKFQENTLADTLKMEVIEIGEDFITMVMPVNSRVHQPLGLLHGGATAALAENVASLAGNLVAGKGKACVGLALNINHIKSVQSGDVFARATPKHVGSKTQVWEVEIKTNEDVLVSVCRLTLAVIDKK